MDTIIVLMEKDEKTGFLEREIFGITISENEEFLVNLYVQSSKLYIRLSTDRETKDWEYDAIFDYFDSDVFEGKVKSFTEVTDTYDPTWEAVLDFDETDVEGTCGNVRTILSIFKNELYDVYDTIKDKEDEYTNEE